MKIGATCGQPYFQQELLEYCQSDVKLLKQGCLKFQQEFQTLANFNPMEKCITIASACNRFFFEPNAFYPILWLVNPFKVGSEQVKPNPKWL